MLILSVDPGNRMSAWVVYDTDTHRPVTFAKEENIDCLERMRSRAATLDALVIEQVASFGMAVGEEVFETVFWSGRFCQAWGRDFHRVKRHEVKSHLCHHPRAKDANIRQAIIDRYGGKDVAIGKKATPGPLYGVSNDVWSALAVAITWADQHVPATVAV